MVALMVVGLGLVVGPAQGATLVDEGNGLIYEADRNLMWLQDANYAKTYGYDNDGMMTLNAAMAWADALVFAGYDDWRLPSSLHADSSGPCVGYNCTDSELGHSFYVELGNTQESGYSGGTVNVGPFTNLPLSHIWTSTTDGSNSTLVFDFFGGQQTWHSNPNANHWAMAVRDLTALELPAPVPLPGAFPLLASGLAAFACVRRRRRLG
jgi:hypothetical protein